MSNNAIARHRILSFTSQTSVDRTQALVILASWRQRAQESGHVGQEIWPSTLFSIPNCRPKLGRMV